MEIENFFATAFWVTWLAASIRLAGPVLLAALGEIFDELAGILNVGIEGTLLIGALTSFLVSYRTGSPWLALFVAIVVGILFNLFLAWMYISVRANQVVVGIDLQYAGFGLDQLCLPGGVGRPGRAAEDRDVPRPGDTWPVCSTVSGTSFLQPHDPGLYHVCPGLCGWFRALPDEIRVGTASLGREPPRRRHRRNPGNPNAVYRCADLGGRGWYGGCVSCIEPAGNLPRQYCRGSGLYRVGNRDLWPVEPL